MICLQLHKWTPIPLGQAVSPSALSGIVLELHLQVVNLSILLKGLWATQGDLGTEPPSATASGTTALSGQQWGNGATTIQEPAFSW
jgi:hypothetical protein